MIGYFARHPTAANLLMLVIGLLGILTLPQLRRETYPEFEPSRIRINAQYPGAGALLVDEMVVARIEDAISGLEGISAMTSTSREGSASINLEVEDEEDLDAVLAEVKSAVDRISDLPEDMDPPLVAPVSRAAQVAAIAVTGPMSGRDLKLYCELLKRELLRYGEVSQVSIAGFSTHQLKIRLEQAALARQGLGVDDIANAVAAHNVDMPVGTIAARGGDILVRYADNRTTPQALADVVVKSGETGAQVRLGDVAQIEDTFAVEEEQLYFNGVRAGMLTVTKTSTQDSLEVLAAVREFLDDQENKKPFGVELTLTEDVASVIQDRLDLLTINGLQGLLLVFTTLWLFFGHRLAGWVAAGLPVSFLGALWLLHLLGHTLNMMTMMGLLVALGLLMDDAIVLAENVAAHLGRGKSAMQSAVDGITEVAGGVLSSFVTTICVFVPLSAIDGRIGRVLQVIPVVLIAVLAMSLIEAFFILPGHLGHSLRADDASGRRPGFRARFDAGFEHVRERVLGRVVDEAVRHRYLTVGVAVALFVASVGMVTSGRLRYQNFPDTEGDVVQFRLAMPPGSALDRTQREVDRVVDAAWRVSEALTPEQPGEQPLVRNISGRFNYNADVDEAGPHLATVSVDLLGVEVRETTLEEFTAAWRKEAGPLPSSVSARFTAGGRGGPGGNPIEVRIEGDELEELEAVAAEIQRWFAGFPGVFDLSDDLKSGATQVRVSLRPGSGSTGVTGTLLASRIRAAFGGVSVKHIYEGGEQYELFVELDGASRDTLSDLEAFPVQISTEASVPLGSIASIDVDRSYATIARTNGVRTATVMGNVNRETTNVAELMRRFREEMAPRLEEAHPDVHLSLGGETEQSEETIGSLARGMIIGVFGVFVLLSFQFRTYAQPLVVMLAIPFAFVGVVWGYLAIGSPLSSQALLGFVSLAGVAVNDSILLMVFIAKARAAGASADVAARQASRDRFRAVLLTSATTIAGLAPLMFETSRQAQVLVPVATSIVFGITASTVLVLVVLPAIYVVLADLALVRDSPKPGD